MSDELNGLNKPRQFDIQVEQGLWVRVTPVTQSFKVLIQNNALKAVPEVDTKPFMKKADGMNIEFADKSNPEYIRLQSDRLEAVNNYMLDWLMRNCVEVMNGDKVIQSVDELLTTYRPVIDKIRATGIEGLPDDDFHLVIRYILIESPLAFKRVMDGINDRMPLTQEEILDAGFRILQYPLRGDAPASIESDGSARSVSGKPSSKRAS